jgi:toxin ParE1/3/4
MRIVRFHPAASEEAEAAADWYFAERPGLGFDFETELSAVISLLRQRNIPSTPYPGMPPRQHLRRLLFKRFPYDIVFVERDENIVIVAIAHHARRPGYWKHRLRS